MNQYHEPYELLSDEVREITRAIKSLIEEFEAVDWYNQRAAVTKDEELKKILLHNLDEEVEHAAMALEWLRRKMPVLDKELKDNLFKTGKITGNH
ncbi:MAG TPA: ferritin [Bacillota bacterium]|nr:ferritin [Bacillota bacterium]